MFLLWMSGTMNLSCFATGFLGWEFGLDLRRSLLIVAFGTLLGSAVTVSTYIHVTAHHPPRYQSLNSHPVSPPPSQQN